MAQPCIFPHQAVLHLSASPAPGTALPDWPARPVRPTSSYSDAQRAFEIEFLRKALRDNGGNVTRTARAIGMTRRNLHLKIQKLGIDVDEFRPAMGESDDE